jgi:RHS repeat-associated protein
MTITDDNNAASPVIDATSYYPFGLIMKVIGKNGAGGFQNKFKFNKGSELQNQEFSDGSGLELYDTHFRELDVQLGRWIQLDPQPNFNESLYGSMKNNPILYNDPLGDTVIIKNGIASGDNVNVSLVSIVDRGKLSRGTQAIVLHRTEGGNAEGAISAWKEEKGAAGAHVVVDKDGKITQVVNFDNKANQVGKTKYPSYPNNSNSVGIEVVGRYSEKTKTWEPLTPQQVTSTADLVNGIMKAYGLTLKNIYEHDIISWKTNGEGTVVRKAIQDKLDNSTSKH